MFLVYWVWRILFGLGFFLCCFYCEGGQTQAAQSTCEVSIIGDIQHSTGDGPEQPAIVDPGLNRVGLV